MNYQEGQEKIKFGDGINGFYQKKTDFGF